MPKYTPTQEDLYEIDPCIICGRDTGDPNKDTCSWQCRNEKTYWEDWLYFEYGKYDGGRE